ncbi:MAG: cell division protein FtsQ/DivIB [Bacillota bacterium]
MIIGLIMVALVFCWQVVQASSIFLIESIVVVGNSQVPEDEVIRSSGLSLGQHILKVNTKSVGMELESHPQIRSASIHLQLPNRVTIEIAERSAVAVVPYFNNFAAVSEDGAVVRVVNNLTALKLPILTGLPLPVTGVGERFPTTEGFQKGMQVIQALNSDVRSQISELYIADPRRLVLYTYDNIPVHLGQGLNISRQADALRDILDNVRVSGLRGGFVDLTGDGAPAYRSPQSSQQKEVGR